MKVDVLRMAIWSAVLILIGVSIPYFTTSTVGTHQKFYITPKNMLQLEREAISNGNGDAAYVLSLHYERAETDPRLMMYWLEKAVMLGHKSAIRKWEHLREYRKSLRENGYLDESNLEKPTK